MALGAAGPEVRDSSAGPAEALPGPSCPGEPGASAPVASAGEPVAFAPEGVASSMEASDEPLGGGGAESPVPVPLRGPWSSPVACSLPCAACAWPGSPGVAGPASDAVASSAAARYRGSSFPALVCFVGTKKVCWGPLTGQRHDAWSPGPWYRSEAFVDPAGDASADACAGPLSCPVGPDADEDARWRVAVLVPYYLWLGAAAEC